VASELSGRGHKIERWRDFEWLAGAVCAILVNKGRGTLEAGADPRRAAYALGW
jgi:gamma-glutamyltranspeptidase/glutathione hydrolase